MYHRLKVSNYSPTYFKHHLYYYENMSVFWEMLINYPLACGLFIVVFSARPTHFRACIHDNAEADISTLRAATTTPRLNTCPHRPTWDCWVIHYFKCILYNIDWIQEEHQYFRLIMPRPIAQRWDNIRRSPVLLHFNLDLHELQLRQITELYIIAYDSNVTMIMVANVFVCCLTEFT